MATQPTLALCMIAKNEAVLIKNAIESVKPFADEMIVVDTGSEDDTRKIAQECGVTVYDFKWESDFSKAKNFALSMTKAEWILFLDADECLSKQDGEDLKKLLNDLKNQEKEGEEIVAFSFISRHYTPKAYSAKYANWHAFTKEEKEQLVNEFPLFVSFEGYYDVLYITRLFKNHQKIYFTGAVHEQVDPSIQQWGLEDPSHPKTIVQCPMPIHHLHFLKKEEVVEDKQRQYFELSKEKIKQGPDAKISLDLAVGYILFENNMEKSFACLKDAVLSQNATEQSQTQKQMQEKMQLVEMLVAKNRHLRALHILMALLDLKKHDRNSVFNLAKAYYQRKVYRAAIVVLKRLFEAGPHDPLVIEYLGVCYDNIKYVDDAIRVFEHGIVVHPKNPTFYFNVGALYEKAKAWDKAIAAFGRAILYHHPLKGQLQKRIRMLQQLKAGQQVKYTINIGDTSEEKKE